MLEITVRYSTIYTRTIHTRLKILEVLFQDDLLAAVPHEAYVGRVRGARDVVKDPAPLVPLCPRIRIQLFELVDEILDCNEISSQLH